MQKVEGSVDAKLWSGPSLKEEYQIIFDEHKTVKFKIDYYFCLNNYFYDKFKNDKKFRYYSENKTPILKN